MQFFKAAKIDDFSPGKMKIVPINGKDILLLNVDDVYYAIANKCTHLGGSLGEGKLAGTTITCPRHGTQFDLKSGKVLQNARILFLNFKVKDTNTYPVRIEGQDIFIGVE